MNRTRIIATTLVAGLIAAGATLDFVGNGGSGYWRARQWNGSVWVRLTLVGGN
jgi:hypothetical protein